MRVPLDIFNKYLTKIYKPQIRFYETTITGDRVTKLDESTLTGRLLIYLSNYTTENNEQCENKTFIGILKCGDSQKLIELKTKHLCSGLSSLADRHYFNNSEFQRSLNILDTECSRRLNNQLYNREIFEILHIYMKIISNRINETKFFKSAIKKLSRDIDILPKADIVQLIFFIGLKKKFAKNDKLLKKAVNTISKLYLEDLTKEEMCIICNATFKTSTKIENKLFLEKIITYLSNNLSMLNDPALFVTFIKTLRHNRFQNEELLNTISCTLFFNRTLKLYSYTAICHILALYSDFLYYDENLIRASTDRCLELLKSTKVVSMHEYFLDIIRLKDIKRLLWCLSNLNYQHLRVKTIQEVLIPNILRRLELGDSTEDYGSIIAIMLYLWMLNYRAYELVPYILSTKKLNEIRETLVDQTNLNLLLSCIQIEDPDFFKQLRVIPQKETYNAKYQLEKRPLIDRVFGNLKNNVELYNINKVEICCQITGINILGITVLFKNNKTVHIEILDDYTSLKNTEDIPIGLMELKIRLLNRSDNGVVVMDGSEIENLDDEVLRELLLDEINFVC